MKRNKCDFSISPFASQVRRQMYDASLGIGCLIVIVTLSGCKTRKEPEVESPTVQPADPSSVAPGEAGSHSYPGSSTSSSSNNASQYGGTTGGSSSGGVQSTYSGLKYEVLRQGTGRKPSLYNRVKVHYHGMLTNGTVFDSSVQKGQPATFGLKQVIPGWTEGLQLMQEGAKYRFTIPPHLAYGARGQPPKIGPNETLIFDIELLEVLY